MNEKARALDILITARRSLLDRVCRSICENKGAFEENETGGDSAFSTDRELARAAGELVRLNAVLAVLEQETATESEDSAIGSVPMRLPGSFARFVELVDSDRLEEASHMLSGLLKMPLDRMVTATRFFKRSRRANPRIVDLLWRLLDSVKDASSAQLMDLLVKTFGFQAVESGMAISALREAAADSPLRSVRGHK